MSKIGIFYGSTTGNTESAAQAIQEALGAGDLIPVDASALAKMADYDVILLGSSTWGVGDLEDSWEGAVSGLSGLDLSGKTVAFFGTGDQAGYPDTFVDALGILKEALADSGARFVGSRSADGYEFTESRAVENGEFVGLALDEDNQADLSPGRIKGWTADLKAAIG